ncbi:DnaJ domain-containing protein [Radiomyces spectabilis]|uniref:DnaJ domain-containing protein n=1 Tax=Radiomyces spectabilis TaxID=64574 RepID=UPI00222118D5|nr:DnaJ domain-containing protein [Radiomyces spectabilis]KAI8393527.1 DnaJ domain-containing protein [Radiomyces spectabilis]
MLGRYFHSSARSLQRHRQHHYDILQVHRHADKKAIKAQYYRLSKKYHPDLNPKDEEAHKMFLQVNDAYAVLGNEATRRQYDAELDYQPTIPRKSSYASGPSAAWHARARRARNTGSASARAQAERMHPQGSSTFNHQEHYARHYEAEERRRRERLANAAKRREAAGKDKDPSTMGKEHIHVWSRLWRLGLVLTGIAYVTHRWHEEQPSSKKS